MKPSKNTTADKDNNRRTESRTPTAEYVDVYCDGRFIETCRLRDLSPSGAFLDTKNPKLGIGAALEIYFPLARGATQNSRALCLQAVVARITKEGIGIMTTSKSLVSLQGDSDMFMV